MVKHHTTLEKTGQFSKLFLDYINQDKKLNSFYKYPLSIDSFAQAVRDVSSQKFNRKLLVDVITEQYSASNCKLPTANCQLLLDEKTFTVCTGHQLCLFTGPLYFIYKIITTINLAEALKKKYPENNFVPIYWMASEDHDFDEVNHVNVFGKKIEWKNKQGGVLGKYSNTGIAEIITELRPLLGDSQNAKELIDLFENAYTQNPDYSSATRFLVNELFGQYGLLIIDPNDARLKKEFAEIISDDIFNNTAFKEVEKTITELGKLGHKSQVNPREINIFYLVENQRNRIVKESNNFKVIDSNKSFTENELKEELKSYPERFSPNVVTRPLYQQKILPNLAYVGGPGEIAYWLEYKQMFDHYKIPFPVLVPRNFVMLIEPPIADKMKKLGLAPDDIFLPINDMMEKYINSISGEKISFNSEREQLQKMYDAISNKVSLVDASLVASSKAELSKNMKSLDELEKKLLRAFKQKNETTVTQIEKIRSTLLPNGVLQERHDNFIPFYLKHGKSFLEELKNKLEPFDNRFIILS